MRTRTTLLLLGILSIVCLGPAKGQSPAVMERLPAKIQRIQKELPVWINSDADRKEKATALMRHLKAHVEAKDFEQAEKTADSILEMIGGSSAVGSGSPTTSKSGTTYYVSKTGSDSNNGSEAQPCLTIAHAQTLAKQPGDVIRVSGIASSSGAIDLTSDCLVVGDLTLSGTATLAMTGAVLTVKGKVVLRDQARLTVTNGGLTFPQTYQSQYSVTLNNNARLKLTHSMFVSNGTSQNSFSMALNAKNSSVVDFETSRKAKGSWLLGNFHDQSRLNVTSSSELPTEVYPADSCRISATNSNFGALWFECAPGSRGTINVPQCDAQGNFNLDFGNSPGFDYSVHMAGSHARLGMNSHPNSSMTINGGGAAGAKDAHMQVGYFVENNTAPVTIKGLGGGSDVTLHFTDQGRDLTLNHVNFDPFAWQVYVGKSNGHPVTFSDCKMNEIAAVTDGLVNISNCVLLLGVAGAVGPRSQMNITDTDIWVHDVMARHGGHVNITKSQLHGNVLSAVGPGSSISLSSTVVEKRNATPSTKKTHINGIPATTADGVPLFNNQNPLGQASHVIARDGGTVNAANELLSLKSNATGSGVAAPSTAGAQDEEVRQHLLHELGGPFFVSRDKVQEELKLSDEQKNRLRETMTGYVQETMKVQKLGGAERKPAMQSLRQKSYEQLEAFLKEILTPEQRKRFAELKLQYDMPAILLQPEIVKELNITDEQRQQFMSLVQEMQKAVVPLMQEARSGGNPQDILAKVSKMRLDCQGKIEALLSDAQKKQWKEMIGAPLVIW